jgi:hypothetical protein
MTTTLSTPRLLTPSSRRILRLCGYDDAIVARLSRSDARFFVFGAALSIVAAVVPAVSMAYGALLTVGPWAAPWFFIAVVAFVLNLLRLHHAGSGYPLHHPIERIDGWRPAGAAVVVLFVLGVFFTQPLVLLVLRSALDTELAERATDSAAVQQGLGVIDVKAPVFGLIARSHAAWDHHAFTAIVLSLGFSFLVCAPTLLRRTGARAVRLYESERWIAERELVDDAWAENLDDVTAILTETAPGFSGRLQIHTADPPYNTRPLHFGLDPALLAPGRVRFVRPKGRIDPVPPLTFPAVPEGGPSEPGSSSSPLPPTLPARLSSAEPGLLPSLPPPAGLLPEAVSAVPALLPPPPEPSPPEPLPGPGTHRSGSPMRATSSADLSVSAETWAGHSAMGTGRMTVAQARGDIAGLLLFLTVYLEKPRDEIVRTLAAAPADAPLFKAFPEWNKLPTLLLKSAGFALDAGLAPLIAIAVDKPVLQVERRLRAAPRDKKVSGVFAPELARRLLRTGQS